MPKYAVYGKVHASKFLGEFEADSAEQAIEMGLESEANQFCLCHQCADEIDVSENTCFEADAEKVNH